MAGVSRRPSRRLYPLAVLIIALGGTIFALLMVAPFRGMQRVMMPGTQTVQLTRTGTHMLFYEYEGSLHGVSYSAAHDPVGLQVSVVDVASGQAVPTTAVPHSRSQYNLQSRSGYSLARFEVDQPGAYAVTATYPNGQAGPAFALAIARGSFGGVLSGIAAGVVVLVLSLLAGIGLAGWTFSERHQGWLGHGGHEPAAPA